MGWKLGTNEEKAVANPSMRCSAFPEKSVPGARPPRLPQLGGKEGDKDIRDIGQQELLDIQRFLHIVMPLF